MSKDIHKLKIIFYVLTVHKKWMPQFYLLRLDNTFKIDLYY